MRILINFVFALFISLFAIEAVAQESEQPLLFDAIKNTEYQTEQRLPQRSDRGGGSLQIPFFDDFSRYSLPTNDVTIPVEWQMWSDSYARINNTFPLSPLTIGVATLDGLDAGGYPYNFQDEYDEGFADTLTSLPIDLSGYSEVDNVYLVFHYQGQGLGNAPESDDSLYLDFYSPFGQGQWFQVWSLAGESSEVFTRIEIPIQGEEYFLDGFRFRFRNHATLSGNWDHWHIDYVLLDQNIDPENFIYDDVAMQYPINTLLNVYTSMPWTHYITNPGGFMADNFNFYQNNLGPTENIASGWSFTYDGSTQNFPSQDLNVSDNAFQEIIRTGNFGGYEYDPEVNDTCATFKFCVYHNPTDAYAQNDTTCFEQVFTNYYAYDDGSAERAFTVEGAGAQLALRFQSAIEDTLYGIYVHWTPSGYNPSLNSFILRVWGDEGGVPGTELIENYNTHNPQYYNDGYDLFSYYAFDDPLPVSGTFYVGWVQSDAVRYNVGNDKNRDINTGRLFYKLPNANWTQSSIPGAVMIRPVFRAGKTGPVSVEEHSKEELTIFPNPVEDLLSIQNLPLGERVNIEIYDISGRIVKTENSNGLLNTEIAVSDLSNGMFILIARSSKGVLQTERIVVRH